MRVVHIITGLSTGGAEMMLVKLLQKLDQRLFSCSVISLGDKGQLGPRIEALGIPVYTLDMRRGAISLRAFFRLRRLLREISPDVIQSWMYHANLAATLSCGSRPVFWSIRQSLYDLGKERPLTRAVIRLGSAMSRSPRAILFNSLTSASQHEAMGYLPSKRIIIANGFDLDAFQPSEEARVNVRRELGLSTDAPLIGLIARYHPMKDHANFVRAAALLHHKHPNVHFLLAGAGVDSRNRELTTRIGQLGIREVTHLLGRREDIPKLTAALDIASSSSSWGEAFPNVLGEAMSCGVPCVATDVGDSGRIVGDTGKVIRPREAEALATAWQEMIELGKESRKRLGILARQRVRDYFSLDTVTADYARLYESAREETG